MCSHGWEPQLGPPYFLVFWQVELEAWLDPGSTPFARTPHRQCRGRTTSSRPKVRRSRRLLSGVWDWRWVPVRPVGSPTTGAPRPLSFIVLPSTDVCLGPLLHQSCKSVASDFVTPINSFHMELLHKEHHFPINPLVAIPYFFKKTNKTTKTPFLKLPQHES